MQNASRLQESSTKVYPGRVRDEGAGAAGRRSCVHVPYPPKLPSSIIHMLVTMLTAGVSSDKADNDTSHCSNSGTAMPPH